MSRSEYLGRFAPSPTGPLHFGSLLAAVASYLEAKIRGGGWLLRMEDLDRPREVEGAADDILRTLEAFGFEWDGAVMYQSERNAAYEAALERLKQQEAVYPCGCSRKEIAAAALPALDGGWRYPGTCRDGLKQGMEARIWRFRVDDTPICLDDKVQGRYCQQLNKDTGDVVLRRADDLFAYQLAVVIDDAEQGITHVVRGSDLLSSTPRQIALLKSLGYTQLDYLHIPVAINDAGQKLSKQNLAMAVEVNAKALTDALSFLGQSPEIGLEKENIESVWQWAMQHWDAGQIPRQMQIHWG